MQTPEAIERVAAECAEDLAADGVVYAEVRYAPELSTQAGPLARRGHGRVAGRLPAGRGGRRGGRARPIVMRAIVTAMRQFARSVEIAELSVRHRDEGVVGFDIAGPEAGFPPSRHLDAFQLIHHANFHVTIHAGEAFGLPSIWEALQWCGAERLGHGVRIVDDIAVEPDGHVTMGRLATYVRDRRVPLEMCPTSNVHTGAVRVDRAAPDRPAAPAAVPRHGQHGQPADERRVHVRRRSRCCRETFGFGLDEMQWLTLNAMKSSFAPFDQRLRLINGVIKPGYARLMADAAAEAPTPRLRRSRRHLGLIRGRLGAMNDRR